MKRKKRIVLGMSGGVDSSTSAALLLDAQFEVEGVTCIFHDDEQTHAAIYDAQKTCERLGITHHIYDYRDCFNEQVVTPFVKDYAEGFTPSPCVGCNARCKIPALVHAADELDCYYVATGHYAQVEQVASTARFVIKRALDLSKDQSYMLSQLTQDQLARLVLPLGKTSKDIVRKQAEERKLSVADKPDSQDICFIEGSHVAFLKEQGVTSFSGNIVDSTGKIRGVHEGLFAYTIGQRKGIGVAAAHPYYVIEKRVETNELVIGFKEEAVLRAVTVVDMNWQAFEGMAAWQASQGTQHPRCEVKLRYRSQPAKCHVEEVSQRENQRDLEVKPETLKVILDVSQAVTAPGQYAVFYEGDMLVGGGMISQVCR